MLLRSFLSTLFVLGTAAVAAEPAVEKIDVFVSGEDGYPAYRIPAVSKAADGSLLAFAEGRKSGGGDTGDIDLVQKRSTAGARTWGPPQVIWDAAANTCGKPCPALAETTGTLWILRTHNLGADHEKQITARTAKGTRTVGVTSSMDHGPTWAKPVEITAATKLPAWTWDATGLGIGIQLKQGPPAGRLVIPCDHNYDDLGEKKHLSGSHAIYADDHGQTWKLSAPIRPRVNESQVV